MALAGECPFLQREKRVAIDGFDNPRILSLRLSRRRGGSQSPGTSACLHVDVRGARVRGTLLI